MAAAVADIHREDRRLFISGIAPTLSQDELAKRLQTYGQLSDDLVLNKKNAETTGIFAHCNLLLDDKAWSRLRKLSGTVLKGSKLRIEEAKQDWKARKALDEKRPQPSVPNPRKRPAPGTIPAVESRRVKRGEIVKDSSITQKSRKQGWIKGRYGRAIAILKSESGVKLPRNPDALSRLWGSAHPKPDQLTYYYDEEEEEWHDRRGWVIREVEISQKRRPTEERQGGRVEVWESDDEDGRQANVEQETKTIDYVPVTQDDVDTLSVDEETINEQLHQERSVGLELLRNMFKDDDRGEETKRKKEDTRKVKDKLDIVQRFDPNAPEEETDAEEEREEGPGTQLSSDIPPVQPDLERTSKQATQASIESSEDEDEPLPSFLNPQQDTVNTADLTSIFKLKAQSDNVEFRFSAADDVESIENEDTAMPAATTSTDTQGIHPDRLNRPAGDDQYLDEKVVNANFTALAKDRGFNMGNAAAKADAAPNFLMDGPGTRWATQRGLFNANTDREAIMARLEESRAESTRNWKRKEREGNKQMRKASNRHG